MRRMAFGVLAVVVYYTRFETDLFSFWLPAIGADALAQTVVLAAFGLVLFGTVVGFSYRLLSYWLD